MTNIIAETLEPLRAKAIARSEEFAREAVAKIAADLESKGWDIEAVAPYPDAKFADYRIRRARRNRYDAVTRVDKSVGRQRFGRGLPYIVEMDDARIERFVKTAIDSANATFDGFIAKMTKKCGDVTAAEIEGDAIWSHSFLTVAKADGELEIWKTQMILNFSVHGTPFNQWPSRKIKAKS